MAAMVFLVAAMVLTSATPADAQYNPTDCGTLESQCESQIPCQGEPQCFSLNPDDWYCLSGYKWEKYYCYHPWLGSTEEGYCVIGYCV